MKKYRTILLILIILLSIFFAIRTFKLEQQRIRLKNDLIELSNIKYGLFNVDEWKVILADIITKKVQEFNLDNSNREEMRIKIESFLNVAIDELEERYYEQKSKSLLGIVQGGVAAATGTFKKIKEDIPVFTDQILNFLNDDDNRKAIRSYLINKLNEYANKTFSETDYSIVSNIVSMHQQVDIGETRQYLASKIEQIESANRTNKVILIALAIVGLLVLLLSRKNKGIELILFFALSLVFLFIGVLLPMIEIDARISEMSFSLLGESVIFSDQVLYYKCKSILEVVQLMVFQRRVDLMAVGLLVLIFSVLFPLTKLICSVVYLLNGKVRNHPFISFMVFKSGKWSMADVMVIAIFMAYIGFDGIISEQLQQLENITQSIDLLTTNKSNLLFGFYAFAAFVILSLVASQKIQNTLSKN